MDLIKVQSQLELSLAQLSPSLSFYMFGCVTDLGVVDDNSLPDAGSFVDMLVAFCVVGVTGVAGEVGGDGGGDGGGVGA